MVVHNTILLAINSDSKIKTFSEFVAIAKSKKSVSVGLTGIGAATYLCAKLLQKALGIKLEIIPYRRALTDLLGGHIDAIFGEITTLIGSINGGKVRWRKSSKGVLA